MRIPYVVYFLEWASGGVARVHFAQHLRVCPLSSLEIECPFDHLESDRVFTWDRVSIWSLGEWSSVHLSHLNSSDVYVWSNTGTSSTCSAVVLAGDRSECPLSSLEGVSRRSLKKWSLVTLTSEWCFAWNTAKSVITFVYFRWSLRRVAVDRLCLWCYKYSTSQLRVPTHIVEDISTISA